MLVPLVIVLLTVTGVSADCQSRFIACLGRMQGVMAAGPGGNMAEACGTINEALVCIDEVVESCRQNPTLKDMVRGMQLDNMRTMCAMYAGGDNNGCTPAILQQMQTCMSDIAIGYSASGAEACTKLTSGLECLESVLSVCQNSPHLQAILQHIDINDIRANKTAACTPTEAPPTPTCSVKRPTKALRKCNKKLISDRVGRMRPRARCRSVLGGFQCLRGLLNRCPNEAVFTSFITLEAIDRQEAAVTRACRQMVPSRAA